MSLPKVTAGVSSESPVKVAAGRGGLNPVTAALLSPAMLFVFLTLLVPVLVALRYSFNQYDPAQLMISAWSFENYVRFLSDNYYQEILFTTLWVAAMATLICLIGGIPTAYFITRIVSPQWRLRVTILIILPLLMGNAVRSAAWMVVLGDKGLASSIAVGLGLSEGFNLMYTSQAVVIATASVMMPFMVITLKSVFETLDPTLDEAAESLGASHLVVMRDVTMPLALPGILAGTSLCFVLSMNAYATPVLIGGPQFHMMAPQIQQQVSKAFNWPFGAALAFIMMATTLLLTVLSNLWVQSKYRRWSEASR